MQFAAAYLLKFATWSRGKEKPAAALAGGVAAWGVLVAFAEEHKTSTSNPALPAFYGGALEALKNRRRERMARTPLAGAIGRLASREPAPPVAGQDLAAEAEALKAAPKRYFAGAGPTARESALRANARVAQFSATQKGGGEREAADEAGRFA